MKKREAYPFTYNKSKWRYEFTSLGTKGEILKIVEFTDLGFAFNLAFGDADRLDDFSDNVISNNGDMREILQSVVNIVHHFLEVHPESKIYIEPVDRKRKLLYNRIFQEKFDEIIAYFTVKGIDVGQWQQMEYDPEKTFDAFLIERKTINFEN